MLDAPRRTPTLPNGLLPSDEMHLWTFGPDGQISEFRHYVDTAKHAEATLVHH